MTELKHMKWWGWGVEGVAFHHEDKPNFAPFVYQKLGLDLSGSADTPPTFDEIDAPASSASEELLTALRTIVGEGQVVTEDLDRVVHTYGKSLRDLLMVRANLLPRIPDVIVYPSNELEVQKVLAFAVAEDAVVIPFGGGSNIVGSLTPYAGESRIIISLDMGRLRRVLGIDEDSGLARIEAGVLGPDMEEQLNQRGWTMGHFPDSFTHSSLGGWVATRSSGMQSDKYGDIADITRGLRMARPDGVVELHALPSTSTGPSVREMILGSEGRLGVITEVTVNVHRIPEQREIQAYLFPSFNAGVEAMRLIAESDASPSITRVSDANETAFTFATQKESKGIGGKVQVGLFKVLEKRGWDMERVALSFIGYEGSPSHVKYQKSIVGKIVRSQGGIGIGSGPGKLYDQKKFDTPYIRDFLLDRGACADVSETAAPWSKLPQLHANVVAAANEAYDRLGITPGWIMCHLSHSYHSGACLYFTFAYVSKSDDSISEYDGVKSTIQQAFIDNGATLSHHHGVGLEHAPWMEGDISKGGVELIQGLFEFADPKHVLNPRKVTGK
ncbi:alkyldihydroxyacetonephosphate synthase [Ruaniaceae bacterium KH17]|nr:alkyldihydroxyacetonephosphate synthase [Ruaniaceae bacterium KH17]